jgi:hypothetical protein
LAGDVTRFLSAATELGYSPQIAAGLASQVAVRMLIQTGRPLSELNNTYNTYITDFAAAMTARDFAAAMTARERASAATPALPRRAVCHPRCPVSPGWAGRPDGEKHRASALAVAASLRRCFNGIG